MEGGHKYKIWRSNEGPRKNAHGLKRPLWTPAPSGAVKFGPQRVFQTTP